ncbi:hypothetical protein [Hymenobacter swuensis]|uniref:hypothetical protein n=1 Tax=Hymenobacter swuensis TaxID=1446467 RepID=UPI0012DD1FF6|nr:hypothetical protein [Hymenobacter swuensis]
MHYFLISAVVLIMLYFLNKASGKRVEPYEQGRYSLYMSRIYQCIGLLGIGMSIVVLFMPVLAEEYTAEIFVATGVLFLLTMGLSLPCFLWYKNHRLQFDSSEVISRNFKGKEQIIKWEDVAQVRFSALSGLLTLIDKRGNTAKAHQHLVGFSTFVHELKSQKNKCNFSSELPPGI